jgi:hypothetical protein
VLSTHGLSVTGRSFLVQCDVVGSARFLRVYSQLIRGDGNPWSQHGRPPSSGLATSRRACSCEHVEDASTQLWGPYGEPAAAELSLRNVALEQALCGEQPRDGSTERLPAATSSVHTGAIPWWVPIRGSFRLGPRDLDKVAGAWRVKEGRVDIAGSVIASAAIAVGVVLPTWQCTRLRPSDNRRTSVRVRLNRCTKVSTLSA